MREIKFRGYDKCAKVMRPWEYFMEHKHLLFDVILSKQYKHLYAACEALDIIPMQYTGLKDKNGKEIYEGDVCRHCNGGTIGSDYTVSQVVWGGHWKYSGFGYSGKRKKMRFEGDTEYYWDMLNPEYMRHCEIIGNIYENPELLNASRQED
jgi:uncharacterized phage protein (TIGR01671 family)